MPSEEDIDDGGSLQRDEAEEADKKTIDDFGSDVETDADVVKDMGESDLPGGLQIEMTGEVPIPDCLVDQAVGQKHACDVIMKTVKQCRHVIMIGSPETGKPVLAKVMSELFPREELQNVLVYHNPDDGNRPRVRTVPAGKGDQIVETYREEAHKHNQIRSFLVRITVAVVLSHSLIIARQVLSDILAMGIIYLAFRYGSRGSDAMISSLIVSNADRKSAPLQDATGVHAGVFLGNVCHDPFQSDGMKAPSRGRVEPGAIHRSNKGVLFADEISTLDVRSQQHLMTTIQKDEFSIMGQSERSSGAMAQTEPVPADFIMIAAGSLDVIEDMHPVLRSRIKGYGCEVYTDDTIEDAPEICRKYARFMAQEVTSDGRLPHFTEEAVEELTLEARRHAGRKGHFTLEFRNLGDLVRVVNGITRGENTELTVRDHVLQAKRRAHSIEQQIVSQYIERRKDYELSVNGDFATGRVNGLSIMGGDSGAMLLVMTEVTPSQGFDQVIATGQLKGTVEELIQSVSVTIKKFPSQDFPEMDVHVQFVQTGQQGVDGDSASITVVTVVISALEGIPIDQSVTMTGSLSVCGDVLLVGGVTHRIEATAGADCSTVIIPTINEQDVIIEGKYKEMVDIIPVSYISEVLDVALEGEPEKDSLVDRLKSITGSALNKGQGVKGPSSPSPQ